MSKNKNVLDDLFDFVIRVLMSIIAVIIGVIGIIAIVYFTRFNGKNKVAEVDGNMTVESYIEYLETLDQDKEVLVVYGNIVNDPILTFNDELDRYEILVMPLTDITVDEIKGYIDQDFEAGQPKEFCLNNMSNLLAQGTITLDQYRELVEYIGGIYGYE